VVGDVKERGGAVLLVSHVLTEVEQLCDRVAVLVNGRLAHLGPLADLLKDGTTKAPRPLEQALHAIYTRPQP
jgi:ABC-type multidrug transport system ATPase subunit